MSGLLRAWLGTSYRRSGIGRIDIEPREKGLRGGHVTGLPSVASPVQLVEDRRAAIAVGGIRVRITELGKHARGGQREERGGGQADQPARLDEIAEDTAQALLGVGVTRLRCLGQLPWLLGGRRPIRNT